ncbi:MAG: TonB family protein [Cytophagaceae bacterium]|jgi:TonB family protein|nr:TonB family protein [Cytophagaceae bacterium]
MKSIISGASKVLKRSSLFGLLFIFSVSLPGSPSFANSFTADSIYTCVDKSPVFKGKPAKIEKFISSHIRYPDKAWLNATEGVVQVSFVITKDGTLMNVSVENGIDPLLDMEALRVVELMTEWKPARKAGKTVHARISVPVVFLLGRQEKEFVQTLKKYGLSNKMPMYVIDNKVVNSKLEVFDYNLKSLRVLKGKKAIQRYGEKAKNGVVLITTKRGTPPVW